MSTPLRKIPELIDRFGLPKLYVKDESVQPYGTWKDRRSRLIIELALAKGVTRLVLTSSGNSGYSLAKHAENTGINVTIVIDKRLPHPFKDRLMTVADRLIEVDLEKGVFSSGQLIALARVTPEESIWDVSNGYETAYESLVDEIIEVRPDYLICPIGSGEGFVGLSQGIEKRHPKTQLIGVFPSIEHSIADKLTAPGHAYRGRFDPGKQRFFGIPEAEITKAYQIIRRYLSCEPSSAIAFNALRRISAKETDTIVIINAGNGGFIPSDISRS